MAAFNRWFVLQHNSGTYHGQDGIEDDVQLHHGGVCVVQNGPGVFKHTVILGEVQVVQNILVTAHFLRGLDICIETGFSYTYLSGFYTTS